MQPNSTLISVKDLQNLSKSSTAQYLIFDCRSDLKKPTLGYEEYSQGHIPQAIYVDLEKDLSGPKNKLRGRNPLPSPKEWAVTRARLGITESTHVILYDFLDNTYATRMWWMLHATGHKNIQILDGGYSQWLKLNGDIEVQENFSQQLPADLPAIEYQNLIQMSAVQDHLSQPCFTLVDARAGERFRGDIEPLDPVAGHVPGSLNRPYKSNLNQDGLFKSSAQLREELAYLGVNANRVVHTCGSGVSACHNLLAMEIAGFHGSLLYAGSWSEWCHHPDNPIAVSTD
jgi:thiosulfate/3-mercaptopyruvate sulfurtransferase